MKKIDRLFSLLLVLFVCVGGLMAQSPGNRTARTIVADVLAQMPADNPAVYEKQIKDLATAGEEGVLLLADMINPPGKGSNAQVEYALSGLSAYVSEKGREELRTVVAKAYAKALDKVSEKEIKAFIIGQLQLVGGDESVDALSRYLGDERLGDPAARALASIKPAAAVEPPHDIKAATALLKKTAKSGEVHQRIAALQAVLSIQGKEGMKWVQSALKDPSREYRNAALDFTSRFADGEVYVDLLKTMIKAKQPEVKVDILNWLGRESLSAEKNPIIRNLEIRFDLPARLALLNQLKDGSFDVRQAAVFALVRIGDPSVIASLADLLTSDDGQTVQLAKEALAVFNGDIRSVARVIPSASDAGKIAGVELLAMRRASSTINRVLDLIKTGSPEVKAAAYTALKDVVTDKDFTLLCGMLETAEAEAVPPLQQAVIASVSAMPGEGRAGVVFRRMLQAGENRKYLYYTVLSATGDQEALGTIMNGFRADKGVAKDAAFDALLSWKGVEVAGELLAVCRDASAAAYFDRALNAYVKLVSVPAFTGENRLLKLREAMEIARTDDQKVAILKQIEKAGTFLALMYAGEFLDLKPLQQAAANAVMTIALGHKEYTGANVKALLAKASALLDNPDAGYQREAIKKHLDGMPDEAGFVSNFNGKDLTGWKGLVGNPLVRAKMTPAQLAKAQKQADELMRKDWKVENGLLVFEKTGHDNLCTEKVYGDFEMYVDWKLDPAGPEADAGIYLRGTPQVQIWDTARVNVGAQVGSGGLYNNAVHESKPLKVADNKLGEWNTFHIKMTGDRVSVTLNGELVTNDVILENYWDRKQPIFPVEQIELQAHGSKVYYRNIYIRELERKAPFTLSAEEKKEGYKALFDGTNMYHWTGNMSGYTIEDGAISLIPGKGSGGNLYTKEEYGDFVLRFEFQLTPAANNGLGIRTPMEGDAAYVGMELQILDNEHPVYKALEKYQYHGSVYGIIPAKRGYLKPVGEWNVQEVSAKGDHIKVTLNGEVILDGNIREATKNGTPDKREHPGLFNKKGHIGFLGHGSPVKFRNIRIKE